MRLDMGRETGPHPVIRALTGLLVGLAAGAVVALLIPRDRPSTRTGEPGAG